MSDFSTKIIFHVLFDPLSDCILISSDTFIISFFKCGNRTMIKNSKIKWVMKKKCQQVRGRGSLTFGDEGQDEGRNQEWG